ncbi:Oxidoreductase AflY [Cytospora mali]|uniref:Oxidoreductase AflY n=1 Tax=Cytospora mali TaxID=578113 RepID=A0A194VFX0_CYTMA|nr:Oxidoreductase AflY [Valsa mali var. pyri (nom. inval.)]
MLSYIYGRLVGSDTHQSISLEPVQVHKIESAPEKRPRTLKHLLRANHTNHAVVYHSLQFHNHLPHILGSAYLLGASPDQLHTIYSDDAKDLEPWTDSPAEIVEDDWRDFLGDKHYQRAYVDFFEDRVVSSRSGSQSWDWKKVVDEYIWGSSDGGPPLGNNLIAGLGHPLIHLGYAYELDNKEIAMEALALAATQYNFMHKYLDEPQYSRPPPKGGFSSASPLEVLEKIRTDTRLDGLLKKDGFDNVDILFDKHEDLVLEYWNAWRVGEDPVKRFKESQEAATALLVATVAPGTHSYNFLMVHLLTTSHAVRILLPLIPAKFHIPLVRQWWLFTVSTYMAELRPKIDPDYIPWPEGAAQKTWAYVEDKAVNGRWATDAHFVKAVRAMREAARTWGDVHERYLASAVRLVDDFEGWTFS